MKDCRFFKEYYGKSFYSDSMIRERAYIATITGEIKDSAEIEGHLWLSREDFESHKYPMIPLTDKEIIPDIIKAKILK